MAYRARWIPDDERVIVVAANQGARDQALEFGYYHCQNRRSFSPGRWIAFYADNAIDIVAEIDDPPENNVVMSARPELEALANHTKKCNGDPHEPHTLFRLKNVEQIRPIEND